MKFPVLALATACALAASAASAQVPQPAAPSGDQVLDDMICFVIGGNPPPVANQQQRAAFLSLGVFFTGKLYGRDPDFDMNEAAARYGDRLENFEVGPQMARCNAEFMAVGRKLQDFGNSE